MLELKGFKVWVSVDNETELGEYNVETSGDGDKMTCWIPSEAGKASPDCSSFVKRSSNNQQAAFCSSLDGHRSAA